MFENYYSDQFADAKNALKMEKIREAKEGYGKYVLPLYSDEHGKTTHYASSILIEYKNKYFLVTNAHVADYYKKYGLHFPFYSEKELVFYSSPMPKSGNRCDDKIDDSFALLDSETVEAINKSENYSFLSESLIETNNPPKYPEYYTFMGYPNTKNDVHYTWSKVKPKQYSLSDSHLKDTKQLIRYQFDPDRDIIIPFDTNSISDNDGKTVGFPKPIGMSGGAIWGWYTQDQGEIGNVSVSAKLIGLIREMPNDKKALIGTKISYLLRGIDRSFFIGRFD